MKQKMILAALIGMAVSMPAASVFSTPVFAAETKFADAGKIVMTPGSNETEMNFSWYSAEEGNPEVQISTVQNFSDAKTYTGKVIPIDKTTKVEESNTNAVDYSNGETYDGNDYKAANQVSTGTGQLAANTTYYYRYSTDGANWSDAYSFKTGDPDNFSVYYFGDPQMGARADLGKDGSEAVLTHDEAGWEKTLNEARAIDPDASFVLSAGDQVNHYYSGKEQGDYAVREREYAAYLAPEVLRSLPISATIGNHDNRGDDYSYHFNNPNDDKGLGKTTAGSDYYYRYGKVLFIILNSNNRNVAEHEALMKEAVDSNQDASWRIVMFHHDIYGASRSHSDVDAANLRTLFAPLMDEFNIDVCLTGHDHTYSRTYQIIDGKAIDYDGTDNIAKDPDGTLYMTAGSASGSKYYYINPVKQYFIAERVSNYNTPDDKSEAVNPSFSDISFTSSDGSDTFTIKTYDNEGNKYAKDFTITKTASKRTNLKDLISEADTLDENTYTADSWNTYKTQVDAAKDFLQTDQDSTPEELTKNYDNSYMIEENPNDVLTIDAGAKGDYQSDPDDGKNGRGIGNTGLLKKGYSAFLDKTLDNSQGQTKSDVYDKLYTDLVDAKASLVRKSEAADTVKMNRLYNPNSGEHFYTESQAEKAGLVELGWRDEGIGWIAPVSGDPVYRLYNPNAGDHHYTLSKEERDHLVSVGWRYEGIGWFSDTDKAVPVYRQYNPNAVAGAHNFTTSAAERDHLVSLGWRDEQIAWYGTK